MSGGAQLYDSAHLPWGSASNSREMGADLRSRFGKLNFKSLSEGDLTGQTRKDVEASTSLTVALLQKCASEAACCRRCVTERRSASDATRDMQVAQRTN